MQQYRLPFRQANEWEVPQTRDPKQNGIQLAFYNDNILDAPVWTFGVNRKSQVEKVPLPAPFDSPCNNCVCLCGPKIARNGMQQCITNCYIECDDIPPTCSHDSYKATKVGCKIVSGKKYNVWQCIPTIPICTSKCGSDFQASLIRVKKKCVDCCCNN